MNKIKNSEGFTLVELLVVIGILGILMGALFPAISSAMIKANLSACGMRGRNLFVAITSANTEREALGLGNVWPKTEQEENADTANDPLSAGTTSASDYFTKLFHMEKIKDAANWKPYVSGVDVSVLSGAGVPASPNGATKIDGKNCLWCVAANITDEIPDVYPVMFSRNIPVSGLKSYETAYDGTSTEVKIGKANGAKYDTPFSNKAFVMIRKGGAVITQTAKYALTSIMFNQQPYDVSGNDPAPQFLDVE
jgi:prepilin-type N-terminal cleavage/methylation domain-containing protein